MINRSISQPSSKDDFVQRLRLLVQEFGSRYALAKASGIPASTLQSYESGSKPGIDVLIKLAAVGNADLNWLLTGKGSIRPAGLLAGALLADVLMVNLYQMDTALSMEQIIGGIPFSRRWLETRLALKDPTHDSLLLVEAQWNLSRIARGDLVLIDRNQRTLESDGAYLLDLPGLALRAIVRSIGDRITMVGPEDDRGPVLATRRGGGKRAFSARQELRLRDLLGARPSNESRVVGRAIWAGHSL